MKGNMIGASIRLTEGTMILFVVMLIILALVLLFFIIRSIAKEKRKWKTEIEGGDILLASQFGEMVSNYILSNKRGYFTLLQINIADTKNLIKTLGDMQYQNAVNKLIHNLKLLLPGGTRIAEIKPASFYVFIKVKHSPTSLENLCKIILAESQKSIVVAGALKVEFDINIGAVSYPDDGNKMEELEQNLGLAVVASERKGVNKYAVYDIHLSNKESEEYKQYIEIRDAIDNKEFTIHFQPVVNFSTGEVDFAETLLRWNHRVKGVLPPSTFLNIMEHTGDIYWVGLWVIEQVFKQSVQWKTLYPEYHFKLSINLSLKQLINPQLSEEIRRLVKKYKVNPSNYILEVSEKTMFDPSEQAKANLEKLSLMGFLIAVDGYRGEHSSLTSLANANIDIIKLSRGFVQESFTNKLTAEVINMLVGYSSKNDKQIVVEGVENAEFYEYTKDIGISYGQGYYFAKPGNAKELMNAVVLTPWWES